MPRFDFDQLEPWEVSTATLLPVGNHVVTITSAESSRTNNENPQIELEVAGDQGTLKDWVIYAEEYGARKVVALFMSAGLDLPKSTDQGDDGKLSDEVVARLVGKQVGVVVYQEDSFKDATKKITRIKGYVAPSVIGGPSPGGNGKQTNAVAGGAADDDIPFAHDGFPSYDDRRLHANR